MKKISIFIAVAFLFILVACNNKESKTEIGNPVENIKLSSDILTPEVLWSFGRVSEVQVSPDEKTILFGVSFYDIEKIRGIENCLPCL